MDAYLYVYRNGKVFEHSGQICESGARRYFITSSGGKRRYAISRNEGELETSKRQCVWFRDRNYEQAIKLFVEWKRQIYRQKRDELDAIEKELQKLKKETTLIQED